MMYKVILSLCSLYKLIENAVHYSTEIQHKTETRFNKQIKLTPEIV